MASTEKLPSGRYRGVYTDHTVKPSRRRVPGTYAEKREALHAAQEAEVLARRRSPRTGRFNPAMTWSDWCAIWWLERDIQATTEKVESYFRDVKIAPIFGYRPMNEISTYEIQSWVDHVARKSPSYAVRQYSQLRASFRAAKKAGMLAEDPCDNVDKPTVPNPSRKHLEESDIVKIRAALPTDRHREIMDFILDTGARPGELFGLHRSHTANGWMLIEYNSPGDVNIIKPPKDKESREVPLTQRAQRILDKWAEEIPLREGCGIPHYDGKPCRSDLVVRQSNGRPLRQASLQSVFRRAGESVGIHGATVYSLRHTFGTRLAEAGVDPFEIARLMGHATTAQSSTYIHRTRAHRGVVLAALGDRQELSVVTWDDRGTSDDSLKHPLAVSQPS